MKKSIKVLIIGFIITVLLIGLLWNSKTKTDEKNIKYSQEAITIMKEQNIFDQIKKMDYSKTIEKMVQENECKVEYLDQYKKINYQEKEGFTNLVNTFLDKNYTAEEINNIFEFLNDKNQKKLVEMDYIDLKDYMKVSNMEVDKINRYEEYRLKNNSSVQDTVTKVNIGLDLEFYSKIETIQNPNDYTVLLNKYNGLPEDYEPADLTSLSINQNYKLRKKAAESYEQLQSAALLENVIFYPFSAYRTKSYQNKLYTNYVGRDGIVAADTYSARPRHSEHELGLAVDIRSKDLSDNLTENDYNWMLNNSYKYGFIVRYAKGTTPITGYIEEPWHLRYLGVEVATDVHEKGITFDEYYDLYLKK